MVGIAGAADGTAVAGCGMIGREIGADNDRRVGGAAANRVYRGRAAAGRVRAARPWPAASVTHAAVKSAPALLAPALEEADHVAGRVGRFEPHVEAP